MNDIISNRKVYEYDLFNFLIRWVDMFKCK